MVVVAVCVHVYSMLSQHILIWTSGLLREGKWFLLVFSVATLGFTSLHQWISRSDKMIGLA